MPVSTRRLDLDNSEHYRDLVKIYADGPNWMRRGLEAEQFIAEYLRPCAAVWGGWFNGRVIGAVGTRAVEDRTQLIGLCVRSATRGRGVARRLLEETLPQLTGTVFIDVRQQASTDRLLDAFGFTKKTLRQEGGGITWVRWSRDVP